MGSSFLTILLKDYYTHNHGIRCRRLGFQGNHCTLATTIHLLEKVRMGACATKMQLIVRVFIDQQPIRFYVAFPKARVISTEFVGPVTFGERFVASKQPDSGWQFFEFITALGYTFVVFFELRGINNLLHQFRHLNLS